MILVLVGWTAMEFSRPAANRSVPWLMRAGPIELQRVTGSEFGRASVCAPGAKPQVRMCCSRACCEALHACSSKGARLGSAVLGLVDAAGCARPGEIAQPVAAMTNVQTTICAARRLLCARMRLSQPPRPQGTIID